MFIPGNLWSSPSYRVSFYMSGEGSRLQNEGLTLLLVSLPADSDDRLAGGKDRK